MGFLSRTLFLYFRQFLNIQLTDKFFPLLGFEPRISGVRSDRSTNCATTTAKKQFNDCLTSIEVMANRFMIRIQLYVIRKNCFRSD